MVNKSPEQQLYGLDSRLNINDEYGKLSKLKARFEVYRYARKGADKILAKVYGGLALNGSETVLDVGASKGGVLNTIFVKYLHHRGTLIAVDVIRDVLESGRHDYPSLNFVRSNALSLGFQDNIADVVMSLFMLYHVPHPDVALDEMSRVLKPDGKAIIATTSANNKIRHREYERRIANHLGISPPVVYSEPFDADKAEQLLPQRFSVDYHGHQDDEMVFDKSNYQNYLGSLATMYASCEPRVSERVWKRAIGHIVTPEIRQEIADQNEFVDKIDRHFYLLSSL